MSRRLAILGCGVMGESLLGGLLAAGWDPHDVIVAERSPDQQAAIRKVYDVEVVSSPSEAIGNSDVVILAVKPQDMLEALSGVSWPRERSKLLISVCAGVPVTLLESITCGAAVVRAMPNVAVKLRKGATGIVAGASASESEVAEAVRILELVGAVERVPENLLDAVTAISGSGPAYLFLLAEAMIEAGVSCGLSQAVSTRLTRNTLLGASILLEESESSPTVLRHGVTSPAGTTAAALRVFENRNFRGTILDAAHAAFARSKELGRNIERMLE